MPVPFARTTALLATLAASLALAACESPAGKVSVLTSDSVGLRPNATYAWAPVSDQARASADPRIANDIIADRLHRAVDNALAAKGYRRVEDATQAQLIAAYHVGLQNRSETQVDTFGGGGGAVCGFRGCVGGWGLYGPPQVDVRNINYTQGTLILDLIDRTSGKLAWRATSDKRVDEKDASQEGLNAILIDMTKSLPGTPVG